MKVLEVYVHGGVSKGFMRVGQATARKPWTFILGSVLAALLISHKFFTGRITESRPDRLWVPAGTVALENQDAYASLFKSRVRREWIIFEPAADAADANMLSKANLAKAMAVHELVTQVKATVDGVTYNYTDLCLKSGGECVVQGALAAWGLSAATLAADGNPAATLRAAYPSDSTLRSRVGGAVLSDSTPATLLSGKGIKMTYVSRAVACDYACSMLPQTLSMHRSPTDCASLAHLAHFFFSSLRNQVYARKQPDLQ